MAPPDEDIERLVHDRVVRLDAAVWGLTAGVMAGLILFVATNVLILQGGPNLGEHLRLLSHYFPGYDVTFTGSLVGFLWAFVTGFVATWLLARVYNAVADLRHRPGRRS